MTSLSENQMIENHDNVQLYQGSPIWQIMINQYHEHKTTSFKLLDLYKSFPLLTEQRVQLLCQDLENHGMLNLSSGRSRIITYDITSQHLPQEIFKKPTAVHTVDADVKETKKPSKVRPLEVKSVEKPKKLMKSSNDVMKEPKSAFKTPASKAKDEISPSSILLVNQVTASPPESTMEVVIGLLRSASPNPDTEVVYVSSLLPKCLERGVEADTAKHCLRVLMDENKIFVHDDEIYIM